MARSMFPQAPIVVLMAALTAASAQADAPRPPADLTAADRPYDDGGVIQVTITRSPDDGVGAGTVSAYRIYRKQAAVVGDPGLIAQIAADGSKKYIYDDEGLSGFILYEYTATAANAGGEESAPTDPDRALPENNNTLMTDWQPPQNLVAGEDKPAGGVRLTWNRTSAEDGSSGPPPPPMSSQIVAPAGDGSGQYEFQVHVAGNDWPDGEPRFSVSDAGTYEPMTYLDTSVTPGAKTYEYRARYRQGNRVSPWSNTASTQPPTTFTRGFDPGLWMIGIPGTPSTPGAEAVLGTTQAAMWDGATQAYHFLFMEPFDLARGMGAWVRYSSDHTVSFPGFAGGDAVGRTVRTGWNLLGNPTLGGLAWSRVGATVGIEAFGWQQNSDGTGYEAVCNVPALNTATEVGAWRGFWLKADEDGQVSIDVTGAAAARPRADDDVAWAVRVSAQCGQAVDRDNFIGCVKTSAGMTGSNPPPMGGGYVDLYTVDRSGRRAAINLVPPGEQTCWDLVAETDLPNATVALRFPDLSSVPADLELRLIDLDAERAVNMRTVSEYSFTAGAEGAKRHLRIEAKPQDARAAVITALAARGAGTGVEIVYTLSASADVDVEVLNVAGRVVGRIPGRHVGAGTHTALWSGRNLSGARAPGGRYLICVRCTQQDGSRETRIAPAMVR